MYLEISNPMDYHVALYIRLSKEDENEGPSESVTNQKSLLDEFVRRHRLSVYDTYVDDGWSGTSFDRPDFQRMIRDAKDGRFQAVIVHKLDRFSRERYDSLHYMRELKKCGVQLFSVTENIDNTPESVIMESVLLGMAEY